jgi:hypothetical protein
MKEHILDTSLAGMNAMFATCDLIKFAT